VIRSANSGATIAGGDPLDSGGVVKLANVTMPSPEQFAVHVDDTLGAGALMKVIDVLGDESQVTSPLA
jgi:hypothetical protein